LNQPHTQSHWYLCLLSEQPFLEKVRNNKDSIFIF
jgi:hypothetical protein